MKNEYEDESDDSYEYDDYDEDEINEFLENEEEEGKSFDVVRAEVHEVLARYFEKNEVPFAWEAKILLDNVAQAIHDQFATHEEDITKLYEEVDRLKMRDREKDSRK